MPKSRKFLLLLAAATLAMPALADRTTDQIQMAASGRFDLLEKSLEELAGRGPLDGKDQHALCFAYSKTKRYARLMACLDDLEQKYLKGNRRTRLFGLEDGTPAAYIMRAEALIETGQYGRAAEEAEKTLSWLQQDKSDDLDMYFNALAALSLARTLAGDEEAGWKAEKEIAKFSIGFFSDYGNAKAIALARSRMALKDYRGVIDAIRGDAAFIANVFLDRLISGSFFTGVNNWVWAELPRAFMLNKALLETGQVADARAGFDRLLGIPQVQANGEIYWLLLADRGRIAEEEGLLADALKYYSQAIDVVETQRGNISTEASKIGFVGDKQGIYFRAIDVAGRLNRPELAYEFMERSKSRALMDLLAAREVDASLAGENPDVRGLLENYRQARDTASVQYPVDMAHGEAVAGSRQLISGKAQDLQKKAPELASLVTVSALSLEDARQYIRSDEALLEFFSFGTTVFGVATNGKESAVARIEAKDLERDVRKFRQQIEDVQPTAELSAKLYQQLIRPFATVLGDRNLLLVPHGPLHYLPFAALHDGADALIARRNLRILPSTSVQKYIRPRRSQRLEGMLILGNPDLGKADLDLPSAEDEATMISGLVPKSEILTRKKASESAFKRFSGSFNYLHIASHGQFKSDSALDSRLLLAADESDDGSLTVKELYNLRLNADLVTLSACETGLGKALSGDDLVGLTRGFLYAGSSNIIASLWQVDDEATADLMKNFYTKLKAGVTKKEALRQAQLELRKKRPEPIFWAAFYLTGEGL